MLIGYVFGYKEIRQDCNKFGVNFVHGISDTEPKEYEAKKDFWSYQINVGDYSPIYAESDDLCASFDYGFKSTCKDIEYWTLIYDDHKHHHDMELSTYLICHTLVSVQCNFALSHLKIEDPQFTMLLTPHGIDLNTYKNYLEVENKIYENEIKQFAQEMGQ